MFLRSAAARAGRSEATIISHRCCKSVQVARRYIFDTVGAAVFGLEGANVLVPLRTRAIIELERARFEQLVGLRTRDLAGGHRDGHRCKRRA